MVFLPPDTSGGPVFMAGLCAASLVVGPFGGLFFGPLADRIWRTKTLAATMIFMAVATLLGKLDTSRASHHGEGRTWTIEHRPGKTTNGGVFRVGTVSGWPASGSFARSGWCCLPRPGCLTVTS